MDERLLTNRRNWNERTPVDFSDAAIDLARSLNDELELHTRFIHSDVYDLPDVLDEEFDIVFTSYGVLVWLPHLDRWASVIHRMLRPGGTFHIVMAVPTSASRCRTCTPSERPGKPIAPDEVA